MTASHVGTVAVEAVTQRHSSRFSWPNKGWRALRPHFGGSLLRLTVVGVFDYVLIQFAIAIWVSRRIFTERDYINAGRKLGLVVASFSVFATWFGAEVIVGSAGAVYADGLPGGDTRPVWLCCGPYDRWRDGCSPSVESRVRDELMPVCLGLVGPTLSPARSSGLRALCSNLRASRTSSPPPWPLLST